MLRYNLVSTMGIETKLTSTRYLQLLRVSSFFILCYRVIDFGDNDSCEPRSKTVRLRVAVQ